MSLVDFTLGDLATKLNSDAKKPSELTLRLGTITSVSGDSCFVQIAGSTTAAEADYVNYVPIVGDTVLVFKNGNNLIVWGSAGSTNPNSRIFVATNFSDMMTTYTAAKEAGGGTVLLLPGVYTQSGGMLWDSNNVSVIGFGKSMTQFQQTGATGITVKPNPFVAENGPRIGGFAIIGDPLAPTNSFGLKISDITGALFDDIWITAFTGTGSIGAWFISDLQTERNVFNRFWVDNCFQAMMFDNTDPDLPSYGHNRFLDARVNVNAGQTGIVLKSEVIMYACVWNLVINIVDDGTAFELFDTAQFANCVLNGAAEQTTGTGGRGIIMSSTGAFFNARGHFPFYNNLPHGGVGAARIRLESTEALPLGAESAHNGQFTNIHGTTGLTNIYPLLWDSMQSPIASMGMLSGPNLRDPYVCMFDSASSSFVIYKKAAGVGFNAMVELMRVSATAHLITSQVGVVTPSATAGAQNGGSPPAPGTDGNHLRGIVFFGSGTAPTAGQQCVVTWNQAFPGVAEVVLSPISPAAADLNYWLVRTATGFEIHSRNAPPAGQAVGAFNFSYIVMGRA